MLHNLYPVDDSGKMQTALTDETSIPEDSAHEAISWHGSDHPQHGQFCSHCMVELRQQIEREQLLAAIAQRIHQCLNLEAVLQATVTEVRQFLQADRVVVYQFSADWSGTIVAEALEPGWTASIHSQIIDTCFQTGHGIQYHQGYRSVIHNIYEAGLTPCHINLLEQFQVKASLVVPILLNRLDPATSEQPTVLWGLLVAHQCSDHRTWQDSELELLDRLAVHIAIAIQQTQILRQVQAELLERQRVEEELRQLNQQLEARVEERTAELTATNTQLEVAIEQRDVIEAGLRESQFCLRLLNSVSSNLISGLSVEQVIEQTISQMGKYFNKFRIAYAMIDEQGIMTVMHSIEPKDMPCLKGVVADLSKVPNYLGMLKRNEPLIITDITQADGLTSALNLLLDSGARAALDMPLHHLEGLVGVLLMDSPHVHEWSEYEIATLMEAADYLSIALKESHAQQERQRAEAVLNQRIEREQLMMSITQHIRESLDLEAILNTTVSEVRELLNADRVLVYRLWADGSGSAISEAVEAGFMPILGIPFSEEAFPEQIYQAYLDGRVYALADRDQQDVLPCLVDFMQHLQIRAKLVVPIIQQDTLWGLLITHQCTHSREWQPWEIELLQQLATQLAIAIQQSELYQQLQIELNERKLAEVALRRSEDRFQKLVANVPGVLYQYLQHADQSHAFYYLSSAIETLYELDSETALQHQHLMWECVHPDDLLPLQESIAQAAATLLPWHHEWRIFTPSGKLKWVQGDSRPEQRDNGDIIWDGLMMDITVAKHREAERKAAEEKIKASLEEKELLLKEVHHRVKNNMQVVSSIFSLQSQYIDDPKILSILADSKNRIRSMALIHEKLYQSTNLARIDFADYIQNLASSLFSSYNINSSQIRLKLSITDILLNIDTAIPCGLLINELVSNSLKHAFPERRSGEIQIHFTSDDRNQIRLVVQDDGIGLPPELDFTKTNSLGLRLVRALTRQLMGTLEIQSNYGSRFEVTFPQV